MQKNVDVFIIGTGPAGMAAARAAQLSKKELSVTAIRREPSYVPCALPYAIGDVCKVDSYLKNEAKLMKDIGIEVLEDTVESIDPAQKLVKLAGMKSYGYNKLILATGAQPVQLPILGRHQPNVFTVRTPADIHKIIKFKENVKNVAVVGGGYIGVETACMLGKAGLHVTLIEMADRLMPTAFDKEFSDLSHDIIQENGIDLSLGKRVENVHVDENGSVRKLLFQDSSSVDTDMVILALGVKAQVSLCDGTPIKTGRDGVIVDEYMQTNARDVYACGDCTQFQSFITGETSNGKLATNGVFQGKIAAANAIGSTRRFSGFINACVTDIFGLKLGSVGLTEEATQKQGIKTISSEAVSRDAYPMFDSSEPVRVKLICRAEDQRVIGGQISGMHGIAERIDFIALAIQSEMTAEKLATLAYCAHPLQTGVPAENPIVMAAEKIMKMNQLK